MGSKAFKVVVGILVAAILVVGGLVAFKALNPTPSETAGPAKQRVVPEGAVADDPNLPLPPDGATDIVEPGDAA